MRCSTPRRPVSIRILFDGVGLEIAMTSSLSIDAEGHHILHLIARKHQRSTNLRGRRGRAALIWNDLLFCIDQFFTDQ
jgi:hypothetical protein